MKADIGSAVSPFISSPNAASHGRKSTSFIGAKFTGDKTSVIHVLDTRHLGHAGIIAATVLETNEGLALFDTGPESTFSNVTAAIAGKGFSPQDVRHVFLSHIHFDHAGAAWRFAEAGATIYVHPRGAPHLLDPTKLIDSATRIYGAEMERLWGQFAAIPAERVKVVQDMDVIRAGQFEVRAIETPGHARHHHVYQWDDNLFGGDVAGVRLGGGPPVPPFVPPELEIEAWQQSIDKIRALNPARLYLPHFGLLEGSISSHLDALKERIDRWAIWFRDQLRAGRDDKQMIPAFAQCVAEELRAAGATEDQARDYERADPSFMAVSGALRYWRKFHPEEISRAL
jgi:glyoxylase-like metal-dependent hydrolase (beta-lactamase superfamily II)